MLGDPGVGRAGLLVRVYAGEVFTIVAAVGQDKMRDRPDAYAKYTLAVTEFVP